MGKGTRKPIYNPVNQDKSALPVLEKGHVAEHTVEKSSRKAPRVLKILAICVIVCLIVGLTAAFVVTKIQLDKCREDMKGALLPHEPQRIVISDNTIQRVSNFIDYGKDQLPPVSDQMQNDRHTSGWQ